MNNYAAPETYFEAHEFPATKELQVKEGSRIYRLFLLLATYPIKPRHFSLYSTCADGTGHLSIECVNVCDSREPFSSAAKDAASQSTATSPYKEMFDVELRTDAVALYVWIEAIGIIDCNRTD